MQQSRRRTPSRLRPPPASSPLRARSILFTLYGDFIRHYGGEIWIGSVIRLMAPLGFRPAAVRTAISRMVHQGWVQTRRHGGRAFYSLTARGRSRLDVAAHRIFAGDEPWNGRWHVLVLGALPPGRGRRDRLRQELSWQGFAPLVPLTWVSPHRPPEPVHRLLRAHRIGAEWFAAEHLDGSGSATLAARCWDLRALGARYREFVRIFGGRYDALRRRGDIAPVDAFVTRVRLVHEFRKFLFIDPGLPGDLLPSGWPGARSRELFHDLYLLVTPRAVAFFEEIFVGPGRARLRPRAILNPFEAP